MTACSRCRTLHRAGLAFDSIAEQYDDIFTRSLIGQGATRCCLGGAARDIPSGDRILELNCGTGEDALFPGTDGRFGRRLRRVRAHDRRRRSANGNGGPRAPRCSSRFLPPSELTNCKTPRRFDGVFSNFSGLNCVADLDRCRNCSWHPWSSQAADSFCVFPPAYACGRRCGTWLSGDVARAVRRWKGSATASLGEISLRVQYPTMRDIRRNVRPFFRLRSCKGIGVAVPPSYVEHLARRYPRALEGLIAIDRSDCCLAGVSSGRRSHVAPVREVCDMRATAKSAESDASALHYGPGTEFAVSAVRRPAWHFAAGWTFLPEFLFRADMLLPDAERRWYLESIAPKSRGATSSGLSTSTRSVREAEGRGQRNPEYYLALPLQDLSGHNQEQWAIRSRTYRFLERRILPELEAAHARRSLTILDLGAGNGWMSYRLSLRRHRPVAVDLFTSDLDGLAAAVHYQQKLPALFPRFQAEARSPAVRATASSIWPSSTLRSITPKTMSRRWAKRFAVCARAEP